MYSYKISDNEWARNMTEKDDPYLKLSSPFDSICVICETEIKENKWKLQDNGWNNFEIQAKRWQEIAIPSGDGKYIYTKLYDKIKNFDCAQRFAHLPCHTNLRTKVVIYAERYAETEGDSEIDMDISLNESTHRKYRSNENRLIRKSCVLFVKKNGSLKISHLTRVG